MSELKVGDTALELSSEGFLKEPERWNEAVAAALGAAEGIAAMTSSHWKVVNYIRGHYLEFKLPPLIRKLCKQTGFTLKQIYDLFPNGPAKGACKVAGLPNAKGCV